MTPVVFNAFSESVQKELITHFLAAPKTALSQLNKLPSQGGLYGLFPLPGLTLPEYLQYLAAAQLPVYLGKTDASLQRRLNNHLRSIEAATGLDSRWFACAVLSTANNASSRGAEMIALEHFGTPPWNQAGFGANALGKGRGNQVPSLFDQCYPGRGRGEASLATAREAIEAQWLRKAQAMTVLLASQ